MIVASSIDWTVVLAALVAGVPAAVAAIFSARIRREIRTGNGRTIGAAVAVGNEQTAAAHEATARIEDELHTHREVVEPAVTEPT